MTAATLVVVPGPRDRGDAGGRTRRRRERAVFERLGALEAALGGPVAPVLAAADLPERTAGRRGYVGEDDGRRLVTLAAVPSRVRPAEVLRVRCRISAPADEVV